MSIRTTQEDHGDTVPGGLGPVVGRTGNDVWREDLAKKVAARHSQPKGQIVIGPDGKLQTDGYQGGPTKWFRAKVYHP